MNSRFHAFGALSSRQLQVLLLMAHGLRDKEIADETGLSESTVGNHIRRGLRRIGAKGRPHAILLLHQLGYLPPCSDFRHKGRV